MNIYRKVLDHIALGVLYKSPDIPDYHLMIGTAERHSELPLLIYQQTAVPSLLVNSMVELSQESSDDIALAIENNTLEVNDMNLSVLMIGNGLGGIK